MAAHKENQKKLLLYIEKQTKLKNDIKKKNGKKSYK